MRAVRWLVVLVACGGDDPPHECEQGTPTCDSSLLVYLPDSRDEFDLTVELDGTTVSVTCPDPDGGDIVVTDYTATCGAGQVTFRTHLAFPDTVVVTLEALAPEVHTPDYQQGGDFCGNPCTIGSIQL
jgi:hypothetical protein